MTLTIENVISVDTNDISCKLLSGGFVMVDRPAGNISRISFKSFLIIYQQDQHFGQYMIQDTLGLNKRMRCLLMKEFLKT